MSNCPNCGIAITVPTSYCPQCGAQLEAMPPPQPTPPPQPGYGAGQPQDPYAQQGGYGQQPGYGQQQGGYGAPAPSQAYGSPYATQGEVPNTGTAMAVAVVTFLLCCWPAGVAGFVLVNQAKTAVFNDDFETARSKIKLTYILCGVGAAGTAMLFCVGFGFAILAESGGF